MAHPRALSPHMNIQQQSLQATYEQHVGQIYQFIYSRVGNREDAEDLTSQVFIKALRLLETERNEVSVRSWLFKVARTTVADYWREHYRLPSVPLDLATHNRSLGTAMENDADEEDGDREIQTAQATYDSHEESHPLVEAILDALPENYRRILVLRFLRGYSIREAAAEMKISESNAKVMQYRALQKAADLRLSDKQ